MNDKWWWNKHWVVRDAGLIGDVVKCKGKYGEFWLEPDDTSNPSFFWIRSVDNGGGMNSCWQDSYVYTVGVKAPYIPMLPSWEGTVPPDVKALYKGAAATVRRMGCNPYTARLEGHIWYDGNWEIVRLFCFQGVQANGRDWIVIDARVKGNAVREDGTAHGDPPH
jgi:hypothetical protein